MRHSWAVLAASVALLVPQVAAACPYCAGQNDGASLYTQLILPGSLVLFPFLVVAFAVRMIRSAHGEAREVS